MGMDEVRQGIPGMFAKGRTRLTGEDRELTLIVNVRGLSPSVDRRELRDLLTTEYLREFPSRTGGFHINLEDGEQK